MPANQAFIHFDATTNSISLSGNWTTRNLARINRQCEKLGLIKNTAIAIVAHQLISFDTSGALVLFSMVRRLEKNKNTVRILHLKEEYKALYELIVHRLQSQPERSVPDHPGFLHVLGEASWKHIIQAYQLLEFVGEMASSLFYSVLAPHKLRWKMIFGHIEDTGVNAIPIVGLLSFLLGIVIGYQGGTQLGHYGANIFVVELVSLTMLRELAPMMTAIIIAGRSGSAFTAQIGTMKVTEEVSAMQTIGMTPMEVLVLPRLLALCITLPLLITFADIMGVFGGMVMAANMLDVSFYDFFQRIPKAVSLTSFMLGVGKAPVFAIIIVVVGCFQGFQVKGSGESVGKQTTISVVQAIFILILADALFSIIFSWLRI